MYLPGNPRRGLASPRSVLVVNLEPARLYSAARAMMGLEADTQIVPLLEQPRNVALKHGQVAFDDVFLQLCRLADAYGGDANSLALAGVDDQFYRHAVMMLLPGLEARDVPRRRSRRERVLDPLCEYIESRLHLPLSLTDMEIASGLSRRSLQYAFWQRYACTPMQWLRNQRLDKARAMLSKGAANGETVTSVALHCGFGNLGAFAAQYRDRYGEQPSKTLKQSAGKAG